MTRNANKITPFLWFNNRAEEAVKFYISIFKNNSRILTANPSCVHFELRGQEFYALNGGPVFKFNEAVSMSVDCDSQEEIDRLWKQLGEGGQEKDYGWLKDKYGLYWQIVPKELRAMMCDDDRIKAGRMMTAVRGMKKIVVKDLIKAFEGK